MTRRQKKRRPQEPCHLERHEKMNFPAADGCGTLREPSSIAKWLFAAALVVTVFLVYQPAWQGGLLWDDTEHVTRPELRSWHGLYRIWFDVGATPQYYPLVHSVFWVEHKLWGDAPLGYHLVTIVMHATAALLVACILRRLAIPGAWLAAAIFALHPVQVESVAWLTEIKNTLSAVFYLGAALLYLRFDQARHVTNVGQVANRPESRQIGNLPHARTWHFFCDVRYLTALGLFLLALATKTVTGTLPGGLLVIFWWQRGRLSWKQDVLPLVPFFLLGAGMGMLTAWWELAINHCVGPEFELTAVQRILLAGRGTWFHLDKLFRPANLTFIYPRWQIDAGAWWQYLYPLGGVVLVAAAWAIRRRIRAPLTAILFFGGTLFPVMGFFNLYTFKFSYIADHYQYLACLGIITFCSAGVALLRKRAEGGWKVLGQVGCLALLAVLAILSWRQSRTYADAWTLYQTTIDRNPACWLAHSNLGLVLAGHGQVKEAIDHFRKALELNPDNVEAHNNLGMVLSDCGQIDEAVSHYEKSLQLQPDNAAVHNNLGNVLARLRLFDKAIAHYRKALDLKPDYADAHSNLGAVLAALKRDDEAIAQYQAAVEIDRDNAEAHSNFGVVLAGLKRYDEAIAQYQTALEINPGHAKAHYNLGNVLTGLGRRDEAIAHFEAALEIATRQGNLALAEAAQARIRLYDDRKPLYQSPTAPSKTPASRASGARSIPPIL